jgi:hypothetical protein
MPNTTTSAFSAFDTIDAAALTDVMGGCGKKSKKRCGCSASATAIVQAPPAAPPPSDPGSSVDVSVNYGSQTTTATA